MVCTDCGCKDYFEDERSDTESLTPHRRPIMSQPNVMPYMSMSYTIAPPAPALLPNPEPVSGINPGAVVRPVQPAGPVPIFPTYPSASGPSPIPFPQPVYPQQQAMMPQQPVMMAPVPQIAPPAAAMLVPQPGPIQLPNLGIPSIPQGPPGGPVPMMPMGGGMQGPPQPQQICPPGHAAPLGPWGQMQI
jgi:hypothetical protein